MDQKYSHVKQLVEYVLQHPDTDDDEAETVVPEYLRIRDTDDPDGRLLRNELVAFLQESDENFIAVTSHPGSQEWEFGVPSLEQLKEMFTDYVRELDRRLADRGTTR